MTETTKRTITKTVGTLFFDNTCGFCRRGIAKVRKPLKAQGVEVRPFENGAEQPEMVLKWHDGRQLGGADAAMFLIRRHPLGWLPGMIGGLPPFIYFARSIYRVIAKKRHCIGNEACELDFGEPTGRNPYIGWWFAGLLIIAAVAAGIWLQLTSWIAMWVTAFAMWLGFKFMCYHKEGGFTEIDPLYLFWPGMGVHGFAYDTRGRNYQIRILGPSLFFTGGIVALYLIPMLPHPTARGWLGVIAMLCLLHFGCFTWMAAFWNRHGYAVAPIMQKPWLASGLGDFWSNRWNRAFSDWARSFLFKPMLRRFGTAGGTMAGFFASGLAHDLVISIPARGGYGLPTLYFLIQGAAVLIEKRLQLRHHKLARAWLWMVVMIPAPLLFHPIFMTEVFNPMTETLLTLWNQ